ncbi:GHKL domain-containing protein [Halobacillus sp. Marseille-Q1614]|uniref:sensor histidine kinase n=1 Tax=Halobacillus sp. Marseille-Q1614 TaxID=2709134 RepID=UPI001570C1AC|nr:GHKL domain-containing protein [Halobacillus sp. Marseille-Q1614]
MLITFIGSTIETLLILLIGLACINRLQQKWTLVFVSMSIGVFFMVIRDHVPSLVYISFAAILISLVIAPILSLTMKSALMVVFIGTISLLLAEALSFSLISFFVDDITQLLQNDWTRLLLSIPHVLLLLVCLHILRKKKIIIHDSELIASASTDDRKFGYYLNAIVMLLCISFFVLYILVYRADSQLARLLATLLFASILIFFLWSVRKMLQLSQKITDIKIDHQLQSEAIAHFREIRSQHHDFIHHLNSIYGLLLKEDVESSKKYISELVEVTNALNQTMTLKHPAMTALLHTLKQTAQLKGITIDYAVNSHLLDTPLKVYEINQILGNLIRNAIEATESTPEPKRISVEFGETEEDQFIVVTNSFNLGEADLANFFEEGYTTKKTDHNQGIGLSSVRKTVEKYNGMIYPEVDDDQISFHTFLPRRHEYEH